MKAKSHGKKVGLVPTMGALHEGHLSLVAAAKKKSDLVVVSIFINPLQFGPSEDFSRYPRDLKKDKKLLTDLGVDVLFLPEAAKMFPEGFKTYVDVEGLSKKLCGRSRPEHFRGVATVIAKLLNIVMPDSTFFGAKDYQQAKIIEQMVKDLNFPVEIAVEPTVREFDGVAISSRNRYLNPQERKTAAIINRALTQAQEEIAKGEKDLNRIMLKIRSLLGSEAGLRLDYLSAVHPATLEELRAVKGEVVIALAAHIGKTRLIDNIIIKT